MSDILIRGMEMPEDGSCFQIVIDDDGNIYPTVEKCIMKIGSIATAVSIPSHGRTIDTDSKTFPTLHRNPSNDYMKGWNACLRSVQQQPTIIPADKNINIQKEFLQNWHKEEDG